MSGVRFFGPQRGTFDAYSRPASSPLSARTLTGVRNFFRPAFDQKAAPCRAVCGQPGRNGSPRWGGPNCAHTLTPA